jgi:hypothetical protein
MTLSTVVHETFVIERTYDAPAKLVFEAWADPTLKARWFVGSGDALGAGYDLDFRVGGREAFRGGPPGGTVHTYESRYHDIVATVEFGSVGSMTRLVLTEQGVFLDGHDTAAQREEGTRSFLESLAASLREDDA